MSWIYKRAPVGALHRHISLRADAVSTLPTVTSIVRTLRPEEPLHRIRPGVIAASSRAFVQAFDGDVLYAVKLILNPPCCARFGKEEYGTLDCASISEVSLVRRLFPDAAIHFMHPVKSRAAIREAWMLNGVHDFVLDFANRAEQNPRRARNLRHHPRPRQSQACSFALRSQKTGAAIDLSSKFGADFKTAVSLLRAARPAAGRLGVAFHVGSQCMDPLAWRNAVALAG